MWMFLLHAISYLILTKADTLANKLTDKLNSETPLNLTYSPPFKFSDDDDIPIIFKNPVLEQYESSTITVSKRNRCYQYPRCLLFDCCDASLQQHVQEYFLNQATSRNREFACMFSTDPKYSCKYDLPLKERMKGHPLLNITITHEILYNGLANLPPTSPSAYNRLQARSQFRIVYMTQGQYRSSLPDWYSGFSDLLYVSYKVPQDGDFYFPRSNLCAGRLSLYLAARLLELRQGWLYNYFIVSDDDAELFQVSMPIGLMLFEMNLMLWQPAVGAPVYHPVYNNNKLVQALIHIDFLMMAYHREALEILHPWILDYDNDCIWASQLMQSFETAIVYRNHQLVFDSIKIRNTQHHEYKRNCWSASGFPAVHQSHKHATPESINHCSMPNLAHFDIQEFVQYYAQGARGGVPRPKLASYHLMSSELEHYSREEQANCQGWHPRDSQCCTMDLSHNTNFKFSENAELLENLNNKVVFTSESKPFDIYYYIWHGESYKLYGHHMYESMGFALADLVEVTIDDFKLIPASPRGKVDMKYRNFPNGLIMKSRRDVNDPYTYYHVEGKHLRKVDEHFAKLVKSNIQQHVEIPYQYVHLFPVSEPKVESAG